MMSAQNGVSSQVQLTLPSASKDDEQQPELHERLDGDRNQRAEDRRIGREVDLLQEGPGRKQGTNSGVNAVAEETPDGKSGKQPHRKQTIAPVAESGRFHSKDDREDD